MALQNDKKIIRIMRKAGFSSANKIADTLQGSVWSAITSQTGEQVVIKVTNQFMHKNHMAIVGDKTYNVEEDILLEQSLLKYLTQIETCPESIVKFKRFFKSNTEYFLVMEHGGSSLFDFIMNAHKYIKCGKVDVSHWQQVVNEIYKQMVECIDYLHSKSVCHFDISLENFLINDVKIQVDTCANYEKITFDINNIKIKLCDFGLAQLFTRKKSKSAKFVGKEIYKSPEVYVEKKKFEPQSNDIWCSGVCLFMMSTGLKPWLSASNDDQTFQFIVNGNLMDLLAVWNMIHYVDHELVCLMQSIFQYESNRICLAQIKQHSWFD